MRPLMAPLLVALLLSTACSSPQEPAPSAGSRHSVRASVVALPGADNMLHLHHEAIDDFPGQDGKPMGMDSMTMPFPVAKDLSLAGIAVGDRVEVILLVDWKAAASVQVVEVKELPADAPPLVFGEAKPVGAS